jgi:hypothetical protein
MIIKTVIILAIYFFVFHRFGKIVKKTFKVPYHRVNIIFGFLLFYTLNFIIGGITYFFNQNILFYNWIFWPIVILITLLSYKYVPLERTTKVKFNKFIKDHYWSMIAIILITLVITFQPVTAFEASNTDDTVYVNQVKFLSLDMPLNNIFPRNGLPRDDKTFNFLTSQFNYLNGDIFIRTFDIRAAEYVRFTSAILNVSLIVMAIEGFLFNFINPKKKTQTYILLIISFAFPLFLSDPWSQYYRLFYTPWFSSVLACFFFPVIGYLTLNKSIRYRPVLWILTLIAALNSSFPGVIMLMVFYIIYLLSKYFERFLNRRNILIIGTIIMLINIVSVVYLQNAGQSLEIRKLIEVSTRFRENFLYIIGLVAPAGLFVIFWFYFNYEKVQFKYKSTALLTFIIFSFIGTHFMLGLIPGSIGQAAFAYRRVADSFTFIIVILVFANMDMKKLSTFIFAVLLLGNSLAMNPFPIVRFGIPNYAKENTALKSISDEIEKDANGENKNVISQVGLFYKDSITERNRRDLAIRDQIITIFPENIRLQSFIQSNEKAYNYLAYKNFAIDGKDSCSNITVDQIKNDAVNNDYVILTDDKELTINCYINNNYEVLFVETESLEKRKIYVLKNKSR